MQLGDCWLRVCVQEVHVKNRCAWLNHSSNPGAFIRLVHSHSNIRLWFSGAFWSRLALALPALAKSSFFS